MTSDSRMDSAMSYDEAIAHLQGALLWAENLEANYPVTRPVGGVYVRLDVLRAIEQAWIASLPSEEEPA